MNQRKRIGIDIQCMAGQKTGFGYYLENLLKEMQRMNSRYDFVLIDTVKENLNTPRRILWDQIFLPLEAKKRKLDLLFSPAFSSPLLYSGKKIVTAHDIIGKLFPQNFSLSAKMYWSHLLPFSFTKADHVITVSECSKEDMMKHLSLSEEKITVIPLAARPVFHPIENEESIQPVLSQYGLQKDQFVLTVGTIEPRKNLPVLLAAWKNMSKPPFLKLVIAGKKSWGYEELHRSLLQHELADQVIILDYVSDHDLAALYNSCLFFVLPSLYEGFGLPVLEAMSCGAACVVSSRSSLPEVGADACAYFDPANISDMTSVMQKMVDSPELRKQLQSQGKIRAKNFSWEHCAETTLTVFDHILK